MDLEQEDGVSEVRDKKKLLTKKFNQVLLNVKLKNVVKPVDEKLREEQQLLRRVLQASERDRRMNFVILNICSRMKFYEDLAHKLMNNPALDVLLKLFEGAAYEFHPKGTVLMREDEDGFKAYVVLEGKVGVLRRRKGILYRSFSVLFEKQELRDAKPRDAQHLQAIAKRIGGETIVREKWEEENEAYRGVSDDLLLLLREYGELIVAFQRGEMFGEIALTTDGKRTASAVCLEDTELMVFTKHNFQHLLKYYIREFLERKNFLRKLLPNLDSLKDNKRETQIIQAFHAVVKKRGEILAREGKTGNRIWVVKEGSVRLYSSIAMRTAGRCESELRSVGTSELGSESVVGEELLFGSSSYLHTARVESTVCKLYCCELNNNGSDLVRTFLKEQLQGLFQSKKRCREVRLQQMEASRPGSLVVLDEHKKQPAADAGDRLRSDVQEQLAKSRKAYSGKQQQAMLQMLKQFLGRYRSDSLQQRAAGTAAVDDSNVQEVYEYYVSHLAQVNAALFPPASNSGAESGRLRQDPFKQREEWPIDIVFKKKKPLDKFENSQKNQPSKLSSASTIILKSLRSPSLARLARVQQFPPLSFRTTFHENLETVLKTSISCTPRPANHNSSPKSVMPVSIPPVLPLKFSLATTATSMAPQEVTSATSRNGNSTDRPSKKSVGWKLNRIATLGGFREYMSKPPNICIKGSSLPKKTLNSNTEASLLQSSRWEKVQNHNAIKSFHIETKISTPLIK